ncbi:MAG: protoheme IX farnesyltransferase [Opitutae bacterium]|nr:protoheme IX farnesyltransferase [Opitutae bacterium]
MKDISAKSDAAPLQNEHGISLLGVYELTKPRLSLLSVFTASLGYLVHDPLVNNLSLFVSLTLGTALSAAGAAALNQWMERKEDALMPRTANRPIPAKLVSPQFALLFGIFLSFFGLGILWAGTNAWATGLTLLTLVVYLGFYTPLKKKTPIAIEIGALSGALPPLIGWVAAANSPTLYGWILFGILFAWQLPHFMAIAWNFRDDYEQGGFQLHNFGDATGAVLARKSLAYTLVLNFFVFAPYFFDLGEGQKKPSDFYLISAILLTVFIMLRALDFAFGKDRDRSAKRLFIASIIYLPLLLAALVIDRYL